VCCRGVQANDLDIDFEMDDEDDLDVDSLEAHMIAVR
jgi:hypothetical protein